MVKDKTIQSLVKELLALASEYSKKYLNTSNRYYQGRARGYRDSVVIIRRSFNLIESGLQKRDKQW